MEGGLGRKAISLPDEAYRRLVEEAGELLYLTDRRGRFLYLNPAIERLTGFPREALLGRRFTEVVAPAWRRRVLRFYLEQLRQGRRETYLELPLLTASGQQRWVAQTVTLCQEGGRITGFQGVVRDISARREGDLQRAYFEQLFHNTPEAIALIDEQGHIVTINPAFSELFGYTQEEARGKTLDELVAPPELFEEAQRLSQAVRAKQVVQKETVRRRKDGSRVDVEVLGFPILLKERQIGVFGIYRDISARKAAEHQLLKAREELTRLARFDALTGLYNRHHFDETLRQELARAQRYGHPLTLLLLDLDDFKQVNDRFGHLKGDEVLRALGELLRRTLRRSDYAFRYGGDEFLILLVETNGQEADHAVKRLRRGFAAWHRSSGLDLPLSLSVGRITWRPGMDPDPEALIRQADEKLYAGKRDKQVSHLQEQVRLQAEFLDHIGELIAAVDLEGRLIAANRSFTRWCGRDGFSVQERPHLVDCRPELAPLLARVRRGDLATYPLETRAPDGTTRYLLFSPSPLKTERGTVYGFVLVGADVTALEEANRRLRRTQAFLEKLNAESRPEPLLQLLLEEAVETVPHADSGSVLLLDEDRDELCFVAAVGWDLEALRTIRIPLGLNIQHRYGDDEPMIIPMDDLVAFQREHWEPERAARIQQLGLPKSFLSVPLKVDGRPVGYFNLNHKTIADAFTEEDLDFARALLPRVELTLRRVLERRELERQQERLRAAERRAWALFENAPDGLTLLDSQGKHVAVNDRMLELLGYGREEFLKMSFREIVAPEAREHSQQLLERMRQGQRRFTPYRKHLVRKDGTHLPVEFSVAPIYDEAGRLQYIISIARDLSEIGRLEQALQESEARYRTLVEESLAGVYLIQDGKMIYANRRLQEIGGYSLEELQDDYLQAIHPEDRELVAEQVRRRLEGEATTAHYRYRVVRKDGRVIQVEVLGTRITYRGRPAILGTLIEVGEQASEGCRARAPRPPRGA